MGHWAFYVYCLSGDLGDWSLKSSYGLILITLAFPTLTWVGVHTIIFVVAIPAAGRPDHRVSKRVLLWGVGSSLSRGATGVQCRCNGN